MSHVIVLDIPPPISVNKTRRIDYRSLKPKAEWVIAADTCVMLKGRLPPAIKGPWEMTVTMGDGWRIDPDNGLKEIIDYCRRLNLIQNDSPKFARRIVMEWGEAPEGCRVTIKPAT